MNLSIVFCKNRKKFEKYVKINKIKNKTIIDIKQIIEEENLDLSRYQEYFNLLIYTRISHTLKKHKDIYYIPNFHKDLDVNSLIKFKEIFKDFDVVFNSLIFYQDFSENPELQEDILNLMDGFDSSQIVEDF